MARRKQNTAYRQPATSRPAIIVYSIAAVLALAGLGDALYLTVLHLTGQSAVCGGSPSCSQVLASKYAHIGPVPVALLGGMIFAPVFGAMGFLPPDYYLTLRARRRRDAVRRQLPDALILDACSVES